MALGGYELVAVLSEGVTADSIVWKRYLRKAPGILEQMLAANPQLSVAHRTSPFIPVGTLIRVPIDTALLAGKSQLFPVQNIWGNP